MFADVLSRAILGRQRTNRFLSIAAATALALLAPGMARGAYPVLPGSGQQIDKVGDDFEQPEWKYFPNHPKSSRNIDERERGPLGQSQNGRWLEGPHRGTPDLLKRIPTPPGGLPGSEYSLLIRTLRPGVPGKPKEEPQQDDLMVKVKRRLGGPVPVSWQPNCTVRVFVPPFEEWENRTGSHFGFRTDVWGTKTKTGSWKKKKLEQYWPGIFINLRSDTDRRYADDSAFLTIRGNEHGQDVRGPEITPGWLTLGLSVSGDGMCHFYAREGVEDLEPEDHLASYYSYGFRAERMDLFFFNVVTTDNGRAWSTPFVIDDPTFYCSRPVAARGRSSTRRR